jgi:SAM-dependent methyltransferase
MKEKKTFLLEKTWGKKKAYYDTTTKAYQHIETHYGYQLVAPYLSKATSLIEFGCGNGSVIGNIVKLHPKLTAYGMDFSDLAISQAKKLYKGDLHFAVGNAETFSFHKKADVVISFFTFEHLDKPEIVFDNMYKHVKKGGHIVIVCPNYGSLIYPSPCYTKGWVRRLYEGLVRDIKLLASVGENRLLWEKVDPIIDPGSKHQMDHDTTIEPYAFAMKRFIEGEYPQLHIESLSSGWETVSRKSVSQKYWLTTLPLRFFALLGIAPFSYWGPSLMLVAKK